MLLILNLSLDATDSKFVNFRKSVGAYLKSMKFSAIIYYCSFSALAISCDIQMLHQMELGPFSRNSLPRVLPEEHVLVFQNSGLLLGHTRRKTPGFQVEQFK